MDPQQRTVKLPGFHRLVFGRDGVFVANERDVYVGDALVTYGEFSHLEIEELLRHVDAGTTVIDVGANVGTHTVALARAVRRVIAIEPQPFVFYSLCAQVVLNSLQNVICLNCGLGAEPGAVMVPKLDYSIKSNYGGVSIDADHFAREDYSVEIRTLDRVAADYRVEGKVFLKIDAEGMERDVLAGGRAFIERVRPVMYVENDRRDRSAALLALLDELGYDVTRHRPALFNPANFFGETANKFADLVSINELCLPRQG
jgi:FkbM family methyltransferase